MYTFLPAAATRDEPLSWTRLLSTALAAVREVPTDGVRNAVSMMDSYAAAAPEVFTNLTRGSRDVQEYVTLLCGLDSATAVWPLRVRQLLDVPPVDLTACGASVGGSQRAAVGTARGEALVVLYNVSLFHIEAGLGFLSRVRADTALAAHRSGGGVAAPNQNAKLAAQHCRLAVEVLQWADSLHADPASPSAVKLRQLHSLLPLDAARGLGTLCGAVAKYVYALSSASTKDKPEVLGRLAFEAAQLPLPACVPAGSSLQLLPSLLLAAYHHHKGTWYYTATKVAEMGDALGHTQYADALLRTCDAQCGLEAAHAEQVHASRQWWGRRLFAFLGRGGQRSSGAAPTRTSRTAASGVDGDDAAEVGEAPAQQPATAYPHLHGLLQGGGSQGSATAAVADIVQVFPPFGLLLQDVCASLSRYERENSVVYFAKVTPADVVQRDVPDVASVSGATYADGSAALPATVSAEIAAAFDSRAALFASLPSFTTLQLALAQEEATGQAQQALARLVERVERDEARLRGCINPPAALQHALDALEALLPPETPWGSADTLLRTAADAITAANATFVEVAAAWKDHHDTYIGASCPDHPSVQETKAELDVWGARATAARLRWQALRAPADAHSREDFVNALVPRSRDVHAYLSQCEEACRDAHDVLAANADGVRLEQVQACTAAVEAVRQTGVDLLVSLAATGAISSSSSSSSTNTATATGASTRSRTTSGATSASAAVDGERDATGPAPQYAAAERAIETLLQALEEAPMVLEHVNSAAAKLQEMQRKAVMTPIGRLYDVTFLPPAGTADGSSSSRGTTSKASARKRERTPTPEVQPPPRRPRGEVPSSPQTPQLHQPQVKASDGASDADSSPSSVGSSQLGEAEEVATAQLGNGATHANVSNSLLRRLRARKETASGVEGSKGYASASPAPTPLFAAAKGKAAAKRKRH